MKLYTGDLYWPTTFTPKNYGALKEDITCEALVVGGGMSGILCAYQLSKSGIDTVLIEEKNIAHGSSSANTGLLQYSSDKMLHEFMEEMDKKDAVDFYRMCLEALGDLCEIDKTNIKQSDFIIRDSIYYASDEKGKQKLEREYKALKENGFPVSYLSEDKLYEQYKISRPAALLTHGDAEVNPYKFINNTADTAHSNSLRIFEHTKAEHIDYNEDKITVSTPKARISAGYIVLSTGYKADKYEEMKKGELNTSYAVTTMPVKESLWKDRCMIWETSRPYFYARTTTDDRLILGGLDEDGKDLETDEQRARRMYDSLAKKISELIPDIKIEIAYGWNAVFGESKDGLPFIGEDPDDKRVLYCLGFGGNGTVYSMAGAKIITDIVLKKPNKYAHIVKPDR